MDFGLLKFGVLLGLGAAAPIGPVNVEIARRTLRGRFVNGFALGCGAVSVDVVYALASGAGMGRALDTPAVAVFFGVAGTAMLLVLAFLCLRGAVRALRHDPLADVAAGVGPTVPSATATAPATGKPAPGAGCDLGGRPARGAYLTGVLMTLFNPLTVAFWFVAVPGAVGPITEDPARDLPMICAGVFAGTLGWVVLFAGALAVAGRWRRQWWTAAADLLGGLTLLGFALLALWRLSGSLL